MCKEKGIIEDRTGMEGGRDAGGHERERAPSVSHLFLCACIYREGGWGMVKRERGRTIDNESLTRITLDKLHVELTLAIVIPGMDISFVPPLCGACCLL